MASKKKNKPKTKRQAAEKPGVSREDFIAHPLGYALIAVGGCALAMLIGHLVYPAGEPLEGSSAAVTPSKPVTPSTPAPSKPAEVAPVTAARLRAAADGATRYLVGATLASGELVYRINLDGEPLKPRYNVVRHAGAVYALADYHRLAKDAASRGALLRAVGYLRRRHLKPLTAEPRLLAAWSLPDREARKGRAEAKLGGAALALVAMTEAHALDAEAAPLQELQGLGRFIRYMQHGSGDFRAKYTNEAGFDTTFRSLYYPGEAILALVQLHRIDPDLGWLEAAARGAAYLIKSRAASTARLPNDHWLMIAIEQLLPVYDKLADKAPVTREQLVEHSIALGKRMLADQQRARAAGGPGGAFTADGKSTPSATRLEGVLALYRSLPAGHAMRPALARSIDEGLAFLLRCQVASGEGAGGFVRALAKQPGDRRFNRRQAEIRIDYVQHALSAVLGRYRLLAP